MGEFLVDSIHLKDSLDLALSREMNDVITQQYNEDVLQSGIYYFLIWILGFLVLFLASAFIYRELTKKYSIQLDECEKAMVKAQNRIDNLRNSEKEHGEEKDVLQKQIRNMQQQTYNELGRGKEMYEVIKSGGKLKVTDREHWLIEYYSILHYKTYNEWMCEYEHLSDRLITILILKDMGKSDADIMWILGISNVAFRAAKSRLNRKKREKIVTIPSLE